MEQQIRTRTPSPRLIHDFSTLNRNISYKRSIYKLLSHCEHILMPVFNIAYAKITFFVSFFMSIENSKNFLGYLILSKACLEISWVYIIKTLYQVFWFTAKFHARFPVHRMLSNYKHLVFQQSLPKKFVNYYSLNHGIRRYGCQIIIQNNIFRLNRSLYFKISLLRGQITSDLIKYVRKWPL